MHFWSKVMTGIAGSCTLITLASYVLPPPGSGVTPANGWYGTTVAWLLAIFINLLEIRRRIKVIEAKHARLTEERP